MRNKYILIAVVLITLAFGVGRLSAGTPDSPSAPAATNSYTLADLYNRLNAGTAGAQSTFTEPAAGPGTGTMHTLNEIMAKAPAKDDTNGATKADVANGKTFWGLTSGQWGLQTGTGTIATYPAPVPKTGQTTSYVTGDDGDLEKGVAWPNPRFTDNGNGTVTDNLTGLIWLKDADCMGSRTWSDALTQVGNLNSGTNFNCDNYTAGTFSNWRLPNVREMQSLVHYGFSNPAVPNTAGTGQWTTNNPFTGGQSNIYWTSSTTTGYTSYARVVYLRDGDVINAYKTEGKYVWPVRGGQ